MNSNIVALSFMIISLCLPFSIFAAESATAQTPASAPSDSSPAAIAIPPAGRPPELDTQTPAHGVGQSASALAPAKKSHRGSVSKSPRSVKSAPAGEKQQQQSAS